MLSVRRAVARQQWRRLSAATIPDRRPDRITGAAASPITTKAPRPNHAVSKTISVRDGSWANWAPANVRFGMFHPRGPTANRLIAWCCGSGSAWANRMNDSPLRTASDRKRASSNGRSVSVTAMVAMCDFVERPSINVPANGTGQNESNVLFHRWMYSNPTSPSASASTACAIARLIRSS